MCVVLLCHVLGLLMFCMYYVEECRGSVVECLTQDREVVGSSLTKVTVLCHLSKTLYPLLSTGSTQEDPSQYD